MNVNVCACIRSSCVCVTSWVFHTFLFFQFTCRSYSSAYNIKLNEKTTFPWEKIMFPNQSMCLCALCFHFSSLPHSVPLVGSSIYSALIAMGMHSFRYERDERHALKANSVHVMIGLSSKPKMIDFFWLEIHLSPSAFRTFSVPLIASVCLWLRRSIKRSYQ